METFTDLSNAWNIFLKDLRLEARQKFEFMSMVIFSISAVLIFALSLETAIFDKSSTQYAVVLSASLWVIFIFAGMLSFTSIFGRELKSGGGGLTAIRSFPIKPQSIFLGKLLFNLVVLFTIQFLILLIYLIFFQLNFTLPIIYVLIVLLVGTLDYACVGTLVSALALYSRAKTFVVPILIFPLIIPSVVLSVQLLTALIIGNFDVQQNNFLLLLLHFIIILMISFLSIETILED